MLERRRARAVARQLRDTEGLWIAQIADRVGRAPARIKAYFGDPRETVRAVMARSRRSLARLRCLHRGAHQILPPAGRCALHGAWCAGCCWALMAGLFALGAMSVGWMVFLTAIIALEKLLPWRRVAMHAAAVTLLALGLGVALVPGHVPGLTLPNSAAARHAMQSMQMAMPLHHDHSMAGK